MKSALHQFTHETGWSVPLDEQMDSPSTLVLVFGPADYEEFAPELVLIRDCFPQSLMIGCSTAGEIHGECVRDQSLSIAVVRFEKTVIRGATTHVASAEETLFAGQALASELAASDLRAVFVLSDGLVVNGSKLARAFRPLGDEGVIVTGGLAGDGGRFERTWVLSSGTPRSQQISAIGFYGDAIRVTHGSGGGWDVVNSELKITHAIGNVVYELNNEPALEVYRRLLGEQAADLPSSGLLFPIAIRNEQESDGWTVRTILAIDEDENSITFAGDVPDGRQAQLMNANFDRVINGARLASDLAAPDEGLPAGQVAIAISCVGRRLVLGARTPEELEATLRQCPPGTRQIGFYSYGELSPLPIGHCGLHNQTMMLTLISEE